MNLDRIRRCAALLAGLCAGTAGAQNIVNVAISGQPLQYLTDGQVTGCGLRLAATRVMTDGRTEASELSVSMYSDGRAQVDAIAFAREVVAPGATPASRPVKVRAGWVRAKGGDATAPNAAPIASDDGLSLVYATRIEPVFGVFLAQRRGEAVQMSVARAGEPGAVVVSGVPRMGRAEESQLTKCVESLIGEATKQGPDGAPGAASTPR